jgi:hypothetical protein
MISCSSMYHSKCGARRVVRGLGAVVDTGITGTTV